MADKVLERERAAAFNPSTRARSRGESPFLIFTRSLMRDRKSRKTRGEKSRTVCRGGRGAGLKRRETVRSFARSLSQRPPL